MKISVELDRKIIQLPERVRGAYLKAMRGAAFELRQKMKEGMAAEAPGGETWPPLASWSRRTTWNRLGQLRRRRSRRGATPTSSRFLTKKRGLSRLARALEVRQQGGAYAVGFLKPRAAYLAGYHAEPHTQAVTPRMRRFIFAMGLALGKSQLKIPARPVVPPVYRAYGHRIPEFVRLRLAAILRGSSGREVKL
jgi:hypothetical protein